MQVPTNRILSGLQTHFWSPEPIIHQITDKLTFCMGSHGYPAQVSTAYLINLCLLAHCLMLWPRNSSDQMKSSAWHPWSSAYISLSIQQQKCENSNQKGEKIKLSQTKLWLSSSTPTQHGRQQTFGLRKQIHVKPQAHIQRILAWISVESHHADHRYGGEGDWLSI